MKVSFGSDLLKEFGNNVVSAQPSAKPAESANVQQVPAGTNLEQTPKKDTFVNSTEQNNPKSKVMDYLLKYSGIAAIAALPITAVVMHKIDMKNIKKLVSKNEELVKQLSDLSSKIADGKEIVTKVEKSNAGVWTALAAFAGVSFADLIGSKSNKNDVNDEQLHKEIAQRAADKINTLESVAYNAQNTADYAKNINEKGALHTKYLENVNGFRLLKGVDKKGGFDQGKYKEAIARIQNSATQLIHGELQKSKAPLKKGDTVWSITSEFAPIKEGGLGAVPVDLQNNFEALGIKTPTIVPMYQKNGFASLKYENGEYTYNYSGTVFKLDKVAEFKVHSYKLHDSKDEPVEVFVSTKKLNNQGKEINTPPLVFVKNDEYFNGTIYSRTAKSEEPEKFAFFDKAVYEFAKSMYDPNSVKGLHIHNREKLEEIGKPNGFVLNDWQAAPIAALSRYKAPMENAYGGLEDNAAKALSDMRIITIGHNAQYQGYTHIDNDYVQKVEVSENILNTLFDNFAADIVHNANTKSPHDALSNVTVMNPDSGDRHVNLLNMGICLSDYFAPVSQNYAKELVKEPEKSSYLQWALEERDKSGTMVGIINGNDIKNININGKQKFILDKTGVNFKTYSTDSTEEEILSARAENKAAFYNEFFRPFSSGKKVVDKLENAFKTELPSLSDEEIEKTPIISYAHRLVDQKGVDILADSIKKLYENWDSDFKGQPKPIFYIAGEDGEGGKKRELLEKLHQELKPEDTNRVIFASGFAPNPAIMAATDFFLMPSKFEPCGLTQSEAFAMGTPVIATATGGIVDTVNAEGEDQTGILTKDINSEGFHKALKEGISTFFNDKQKYNKMVMNSLKQDFSWIQPGRKGPIYDYLELFGVDKSTLAEKSEL